MGHQKLERYNPELPTIHSSSSLRSVNRLLLRIKAACYLDASLLHIGAMDQIVRHSDSDPDSAIAAHVQPGTRQTDPETIFSNIYDYPWDEDSEFQSGLSSILGSKEEPPSGGSTGGPTYHDRDLLLQAQCFYFTRYGASSYR